MLRRSMMAALVAATASAYAREAGAADAHGFGEKHQLIVTADRLAPLLSYERTSNTFPQGNQTVTDSVSRTSTMMLFSSPLERLTVHTVPRVAFDFAVIPRLTVGGFVALGLGLDGSQQREVSGVERPAEDAGTGSLVGVGPRVGYVLPLGDVLAIWLRGGASFYSVTTRRYEEDNNARIRISTSTTAFSLDLDPQLTIVPLEHFYFGVGPLVNIPIAGTRSVETSASPLTTSTDFSQLHIGVTASLGGWFSL